MKDQWSNDVQKKMLKEHESMADYNQLWDNISLKRKEEKKRRAIWWWASGGVVVAALLIVFMIPDGHALDHKKESLIVEKGLKVDEDFRADKAVKIDEGLKVDVDLKVDEGPQVDKSVGVEEGLEVEEIANLKPRSKNVSPNVHKAIQRAEYKPVVDISKKSQNANRPSVGPIIGRKAQQLRVNSIFKLTTLIAGPLSFQRTTLSNLPFHPAPSCELLASISDHSEPSSPRLATNDKPSSTFGISGGYSFVHQSLKSNSTATEDWINWRSEHEIPLERLHLEATWVKPITGPFFLTIGLGHSRLSTEWQDNISIERTEIREEVVEVIIDVNGNREEILGLVEAHINETTDYTNYQTFSTTYSPLLIGVAVPIKRGLFFQAKMGAEIGWVTQISGRTKNYLTDGVALTNLSAYGYQSNINWTGRIDLNWQFLLSDQWSLDFGLLGRYGMNGLGDKSLFEEKHHSFGAQIGLNYHL